MKVLAVLLSSALLLIIMPAKAYGNGLAKSTSSSNSSGYSVEARFYNKEKTQIAGNYDGFNSKSYILFEKLNIPSGSTILNANIELTIDRSYGQKINLYIGNELASSSSAPTNSKYLNQKLRQQYSHKTWQNIPKGLTGTKILSPDISTLIQESVNRSDWNKGNSLLIFLTDNFSDLNSYIQFFSANSEKQNYKPKLTISFIPSKSQSNNNVFIEEPELKIISPTPSIFPTPTPLVKNKSSKIKKSIVLTRIINGGSSDSYIDGTIFDDKSMTQSFGKNSIGEMENFLMFEDISIPPKAKIKNAAISFTMSGATGGKVNTEISVNVNFDSVVPINIPTFNSFSQNLSSNQIIWKNIPEGKWGSLITTPDLSSLIQEIIDSKNWTNGNNVMFYFKDSNSDEWSDRTFLTGDFSGTDAKPTLLIEYEIEVDEEVTKETAGAASGFDPFDTSLILTPILNN